MFFQGNFLCFSILVSRSVNDVLSIREFTYVKHEYGFFVMVLYSIGGKKNIPIKTVNKLKKTAFLIKDLCLTQVLRETCVICTVCYESYQGWDC